MGDMKTYDPSQVVVIVGGSIVKSWISVAAARDEENFMMTVGTQGEVTRTKNANKMGVITLVLPQASVDNLTLSGFFNLGTQISVSVTDKSGVSLHVIPEATVTKSPDAAYGKEAGEYEWLIRGNLSVHVLGGNPVAIL